MGQEIGRMTCKIPIKTNMEIVITGTFGEMSLTTLVDRQCVLPQSSWELSDELPSSSTFSGGTATCVPSK